MHLVYGIGRLAAGGAQRQAVELAKRLVRHPDIRVSLLGYPGENFFTEALSGSGVDVIQLPKRNRLDLSYPLRMRKWLVENQVDVVHSFTLGPVLWWYAATRGLARPVVIPAERNTLEGMPSTEVAIKRWIFKRSGCVTANSHEAADLIRKRFAIPPERVVFLPNAIDVDQWQQCAHEDCSIALDRSRFNVGVVGRIAPAKNHQLVLEALTALGAEAKRWRVWFVGDELAYPKLTAQLRTQVQARNLQDIVRFLAPMSQLAPFVAQLDGLLLPSTREGFPNVVLEAMSLGVPVVAASVGEVPYMLEHASSGLLVDSPNPDNFAAAMSTLRSMPGSQRSRLIEQARRTVQERYSIDAVASAHLDFYREVLVRRT